MPLFGKKKQEAELNTEQAPEQAAEAQESATAAVFDEEGTEQKGQITVRICSRKTGLEEYTGVPFVRVFSKRYNLLILKDYVPLIGEIQGSISFHTRRQEIRRENIEGYFMLKQNVFSLMLKSEGQAVSE